MFKGVGSLRLLKTFPILKIIAALYFPGKYLYISANFLIFRIVIQTCFIYLHLNMTEKAIV